MLYYNQKRKENKIMTKKQMKEKNNRNRVRVLFNTGTRTHKSAKDWDRQENKLFCKKYLTD